MQTTSSLYKLLRTVQSMRIDEKMLEREFKKPIENITIIAALEENLRRHRVTIDECIEDLKRSSTIKIFV